MAEYEKAKEWVEKVIDSCTTNEHILSSIKVIALYFERYVYTSKQNLDTRVMMLTSSPLYARLREKQLRIKLLGHEKIS